MMEPKKQKNQKGRRRKIGKCQLCEKIRPLCKSHIVPEFLLKHTRDSDNKTNYIRIMEDGSGRIDRIQKNHRDLADHDRNILCECCEGLFNTWETPVAWALYGEKNLKGRSTEFQHFETDLVERCRTFPINYTDFKLFYLSLLWRLSASEMEFCHLIDLGFHQEKLRKLLLAKDPGSDLDYPCVLVNITHEKYDFTDFIDKEFRIADNRTVFIQLFAGGFVFNMYVSNLYCPRFLQNFFLRESGELPLLYRDITSFHAFQEILNWGEKFFHSQN